MSSVPLTGTELANLVGHAARTSTEILSADAVRAMQAHSTNRHTFIALLHIIADLSPWHVIQLLGPIMMRAVTISGLCRFCPLLPSLPVLSRGD